MSIAGDHAHNDMYGQGEEYWDAEDPMSEDNSWYMYFSNAVGYKTISNHSLASGELQGLLDMKSILNVWIDHSKNNIKLEDAYHSMYPEE